MPKGNGGKNRNIPVIPGERPEPPPELTQEEAREWRTIVARMPQDWFPAETWPVLVDLCRLICNSRMVNAELHKTNPADKRFHELIKHQFGYSKSIGTASAKLRLTPQARYAQSEARHRDPTPHVRPWDLAGGVYADIRKSRAWGDPDADADEGNSNRGD
jgi:hypothetical protein